ncbi:MAG: membrane protein insertion efficiency factor YidD [Fidelibacterota bacterium]|nr:MAG: membrane protein insertion efficiency factor YidD [Candidatus Neomarinimicrobiota bacterium]
MIRSIIRKATVKILTVIIRVYQNTFSLLFPPACRYTPSCSQYAIDALNKHGAIKGLYLSGKRLMRCHPFTTHSGYDPA